MTVRSLLMSEETPRTISVSIVNFNTWGDTVRCLETIRDQTLPSQWRIEILVFDNGSEPPPDTLGLGESVDLMRAGRNQGFGSGHNANFLRASGEMFFVLNPDTELCPNALGQLARALDDEPGVGGVAPQLLDADGSVQPSCRRFPRPIYDAYRVFGVDHLRIPPFSDYLMSSWDHRDTRLVEQAPGAALMMRSLDYETVGGFSKAFPMYFEDVDLCLRLNALRGPVLFLSEAKVRHAREGTASRNRAAATFWIEWSRHVYYKRSELGYPGRVAARAISIFGSTTRLIVFGVLASLRPSRRADFRSRAVGHASYLKSIIFGDEAHWRSVYLTK